MKNITRFALIFTFFPLPAYFPLNTFAALAPVSSQSGELLQNNPLLKAPSPPQTKSTGDPLATLTKKRHSDVGTDGPKIKVRQLKVIDAPGPAQKDIKKFIDKFANTEMSLADLKNVAIKITSILQFHGEYLSYAYIPRQKIINDTVTIAILNGYIEAVDLADNASLVHNFVLNRFIARLNGPEKGSLAEVNETLLLIGDLPGISALSPTLMPGNNPGGSRLTLDLQAAKRFESYLLFDNMGSVTSGRNRAGIQLTINSPAGLGDRLQALAFIAPDRLQINNKSKHGKTAIARVSYDLPVNTRGGRAGVALSRVSYRLGGPLLSGLGDGFADVLSFYGSQPIIRSDKSNLTLGLSADIKRMDDTFWDEKNARRAAVIGMQLTGSRQSELFGRPNVLQYDLSYGAGRLNNDDAWNGLHTRGTFFKSGQQIKFIQNVLPGIAINFSLTGQQASKNLDGAEKISLGGPYAVRAYSNSTASADSAWITSTGLQFALPWVKGLSTRLFYDYATGKINKFSRQQQTVTLAGHGIGADYQLNDRLFISASYAWRDGHDALLPAQNKAMGWITAGVHF
ncbi:ShlB/FhaC/HecB family hemolysin secretion/activation protein [Mixta intestinalis]|uniref:Heme/hemopexin transporter protein HuxB n=1 Tax=Mixta intestinalis TaxID=1615494 RepID=A0A6P1PWJ1_9GAMM|nr:ShlB/FhaC/HecB family hemolysin secretion/activation protein [Mixta intestinalis]QHM70414.1 Heme/hemopexin transporter protein HuxB [Mixta intestinalis]